MKEQVDWRLKVKGRNVSPRKRRRKGVEISFDQRVVFDLGMIVGYGNSVAIVVDNVDLR